MHASFGTASRCSGCHEDEARPACLPARNMARLIGFYQDVPLQDEKMGSVGGQLESSVDWEAVTKTV